MNELYDIYAIGDALKLASDAFSRIINNNNQIKIDYSNTLNNIQCQLWAMDEKLNNILEKLNNT